MMVQVVRRMMVWMVMVVVATTMTYHIITRQSQLQSICILHIDKLHTGLTLAARFEHSSDGTGGANTSNELY